MSCIIVLVALIQCILAFRSCSPPEPYYNKYINHPSMINCVNKYVPSDGKKALSASVINQLCSAPSTYQWKKGIRVNKELCHLIPKYTAIGSFTGPRGTFNVYNDHAGILISCFNGYVVMADQWCARPDKFNQRLLKKGCRSTQGAVNCADHLYTIEW